MTTDSLLATATPAHALAADATPRCRLSFGRVLRSEWIKAVTVQSTWWSILVVVTLSIGMSLLLAYALTAAPETDGESLVLEPLSTILGPTQFTVLLAGVIGAITVTGEYSTGMIRSTLTAVPSRGAVLTAKAIVAGLLLALTSAVVFVAAALATAPFLAGNPVEWGDPMLSTIPILYGVLSMAAFALIGLAFGFISGNGAGAIAGTVALLFLLPPLVSIFPTGAGWQWLHNFGDALPGPAAQALMTPGTESGLTDGWALLALAAWVTAGLVGAWVVLRHRDA
jgi:ABC-2 type transport system permease protein